MLKLGQMIFFILNSILALVGVYISRMIFLKKKSSESVVCYIGGSCDDVLSSKFSKFFGVGIDIFGIIYYSVLFLGYLYLSIFKPMPEIIFGLFVMAFIGFSFSLYLVFVQALYLKKWCLNCFSSAINSVIIFILASISFSDYFGVVGVYLAEMVNTLSLVHLIGVAIGVSAATIGGFMIINFLKDFKIDSHEDRKLTILDQIVWLAVATLLVVNLCYYIIDPELYFGSSQFLSQLVIFIVLIINNAFLSLYINPKLIGIRIDMKSINVFRTFWLRQCALAMGVISIISWYTILFVSFFAKITDDSIINVISYYVAITIMAVIVSQLAILLVDKIKITSDNTYKFK